MTATNEQVEQVLVVPTSVFHEIGHFQGFCGDTEPYMKALLDPAYTSYRPRPEMEEDPSFKQLIPYCIFRCQGEVFYYRRGKETGEARLHAKRSIGVGGHVSSIDEKSETGAYREGMRREIEEEVYLEAGWTENLVGLINDDESEVGRVHLGLVHIFDLDQPKVRAREASMIDTGFAPPAQLVGESDEFETWSEICLRNLFPN